MSIQFIFNSSTIPRYLDIEKAPIMAKVAYIVCRRENRLYHWERNEIYKSSRKSVKKVQMPGPRVQSTTTTGVGFSACSSGCPLITTLPLLWAYYRAASVWTLVIEVLRVLRRRHRFGRFFHQMIVLCFEHNTQKQPDGKQQDWDPRHDFDVKDSKLREYRIVTSHQVGKQACRTARCEFGAFGAQ